MMDSRSFCGMSPCMDDTVKLASLIFSVSQSTCTSNQQTRCELGNQTRQYVLDLPQQPTAQLMCVHSPSALKTQTSRGAWGPRH